MDDIETRVTVLEVHKDNHLALLTEIKDDLAILAKRVSDHMDNEESWRWKVAAGLISLLFLVCFGLIAFIFEKGLIA